MRVPNGRFYKVGRDNGKPVRFYGPPQGIGDTVIDPGTGLPVTVLSPVANAADYLSASPALLQDISNTGGSTITSGGADLSTIGYSTSVINFGSPVGTAVVTPKSNNMSLLVLVMAGAAILFAMK